MLLVIQHSDQINVVTVCTIVFQHLRELKTTLSMASTALSKSKNTELCSQKYFNTLDFLLINFSSYSLFKGIQGWGPGGEDACRLTFWAEKLLF